MSVAARYPISKLIINPNEGTIDRVFHKGTIHRSVGLLSTSGHLVLNLAKRPKAVHVLIWEAVNGPVPEGLEVDHINRVKTDNRIINLRLVTRSQNNQNRVGPLRNNKLGVRGVSQLASGKYKAQISIDGKAMNLGHFDTIKEAEFVYKQAQLLYHTHSPEAG